MSASGHYLAVPPKTPYKATAMTLAVMATQSADGNVYLVHFKHSHRNFILASSAPKDIQLGEFVIVDADRGEDIGVIVEIVPAYTFVDDKHTAGHRGKGFATDQSGEIRKVLRIASPDEVALLPMKAEEERAIAEVCREKVEYQFQMPITIVDTEFQVDRHKLTIYYEAQRRIDFRELVRDLFALYKTRIWMAQVDSSFEPNLEASQALIEGKRADLSMYPRISEGSSTTHPGPASSLNPNASRYVAAASTNYAKEDSSYSSSSWQQYNQHHKY
jgi:cell fate regulator YaaT (PSP1 superfamily)